MIGGVYGYAAIGVVVGGLGLACYGLYYKAEASDQKAQAAIKSRDVALASLKEAEADKAALKTRAAVLDATLVSRDARIRALDAAKRKAEGEMDALKKTLPAEDQACLSRSLPPAIAERLRN